MYINFPTDIDHKPIVETFAIFIDLLIKAYKLDKYNKKSKYDKY